MENEVEAAGFWSSYENGFTRWVERLQGHMPDGTDTPEAATGFLSALWHSLLWVIGNIIEAFYNIAFAIFHPGMWLSWVPHISLSGKLPDLETAQSLMRFIYYGASQELFFAAFTIFLIVTIVGFLNNRFMWGAVRALEGFANGIGRFFAWAGLLMVLIQIMIIFMQRIFAVSEISFGFGMSITHDVSWWAEGLKFWNALIVTLCVTYTFVQGAHVRVDLVYAAVGHRAKRIIDMFGSMFFMVPVAVLTWMYGWFFMWRHLVVPNPSATDTLDRLLNKARALKFNVETIGFSPNGFNAYFLFKILLVLYTGIVMIHAVAFFYRSYLEFKEGEDSVGKFLDKDTLGEGEEAYEGTH